MSRRLPGEPGAVQASMSQHCGFDGGDASNPVCGAPATNHHWGGAPPDIQHDWVMFSCDTHFDTAADVSWDWHPVSPVCNIPGTKWTPRGIQGEGFCYWPEAEAAMHEAVNQEPALERKPR